MSERRIGLLAVQGAIEPHRRALADLGAVAVPVRLPSHLDGLDGIVMPGGESTTIGMLLDSTGLREPLAAAIAGGLPTLATCAGLIMLATAVADGRPDQVPLAVLDVSVRRNAYGRQNQSFEGPVSLDGEDEPFDAVFIRAPAIERVGEGVSVLGTYRDAPVLVRQGSVVAATFHPELSADDRIHRRFLGL